MSGTERLNTASTGSMVTTEPRVHAVPSTSSCEILAVDAESAVQNL